MRRMLALIASLTLIALPVLAEDEEPETLPMDDLEWTDGDLQVEKASTRTLTAGQEGEDVRLMQVRLAELGYYDGEITGSFGANTASAVESFQEDFHLEVTGVADETTQALMYATAYRPLRYGSQGEQVKNLQTRLMILGYYTGKVSGNYLDATKEAVAAFQARNALAATGEADTATQTALYAGNARGKGDSPLPTVTPPPLEEKIFLVDEENEVNLDAPTEVPYVKQLKYEMKGDQVTLLQERLVELGYYDGPVSGNFLGNTRNAVRAFQKQNGLGVDGIVGQATWDALFNDPEVALPDDTAKPTATPEPPVFHIVVDVNNQVTTVYGRDENGQHTIIVRQMLCSTGTKSYPSDVGDWTLNGKTARWCYFPKWGGHAQYWTRINRNIAFHSVCYSAVDTKALKVSSYNSLGKRASHGCIRLLVSDAKWIYDNCGAGTTVTITEDMPADPELRAALAVPKLNRDTMLPYTTEAPTAPPNYVSGAQPPLPLEKLKKNDSSEAVFWLQSKLKELGYYGGSVTGTYLDGTVNAVKAFQKANGLSQNGVADVATLERIYAKELATPTPPPTATPAPAAMATPEPTGTPEPAETPEA